MQLLIRAGIAPVCGAALPDGPQTTHSRCRARGALVSKNPDGTDLHFNHWPPLQPHERGDRRAVCDPRRIELLCRTCHNAAEPHSRG
ncbi:MAG: hypothetical protein AB7Q29_14875 [Vicinamibacterales bacterium]